jgi:Na+/proline symporter
MNGALVGIVAAALLALGLGFLARRGRQMGLGQWTVAGRSFGAPLVFLLMAGEIYTTFAFLGGSGFCLRAGRPGLLHSVLRDACLCDVVFHAAADLALCARSRPLFTGRLFRQQI